MGFYGNLTNTARTQFQFDKVYPNRYSMERNIATDGVYLGRYVLVEYDANIHEDSIKTAYLYADKFYTTIDHTHQYVFNTYTAELAGVVDENNFINYFIEENGLHRPATGFDVETLYYSLTTGDLAYGIEKNEILQGRNTEGTLTGQFFQCVGVDEAGYAVFSLLTEAEDNNYLLNYQIDTNYYGPRSPEGAYSRAWDSTVWQKIYAAGEVKYLMIAELNTASPSFSITYDPPTQTPLAPHVDASSANNVYRVHLQPTWGFRIKKAENEDLSDIQVEHIYSTYNSKNNRVDQHKQLVNGAIYWNDKGYDKVKSVHDTVTSNYIMLEPTGQSGMEYASHKGYVPTTDTTYQAEKNYYIYDNNFLDYTQLNTSDLIGQTIEDPLTVYEYTNIPTYDINEMTINVPAFGNAVADFYDLMYGVNPDNKNLRYRDVSWKYYHGDQRDDPSVELGGMTRDRSTVAGSLNYIHDLTGMIISEIDSIPTTEEVQNNLSSDLIYYLPSHSTLLTDRYFYRAKTYTFNTEKVPYEYQLVDATTEPYITDCYFKLPAGTTVTDETVFLTDLAQQDYNANYDYYKRLINGATYTSVGLLTNYASSSYYYSLGPDYYVDTESDFKDDRDYYHLSHMVSTGNNPNALWKVVNGNSEIEEINYYFLLTDLDSNDPDQLALLEYYHSDTVEIGWFDTEDVFFQDEKTYYTIGADWRVREYTSYAAGDQVPDVPRIVEKITNAEIVSDLAYPQELATYCRIVTENVVTFKENYLANAFYYLDKIDELELDTNVTVDINDYVLDTEYPYTTDRHYYQAAPIALSNETVIYKPNKYFYFDNDDGENLPFNENAQVGDPDYVQALAHLDDNEYPTAGRFYWQVELSDMQLIMTVDGQMMYVQTIIGWDRIPNLVSVTGQFRIYNEETTRYDLTPENPTFIYYYKENEDDTRYHIIHTNNRNVLENENYSIYTIDFNSAEYLSNSDFYVKNKYYYFDESRNILLDQQETHNDALHYAFTVNENTGYLGNMNPVRFYIPETYYYKVGNNYVLDLNDSVTNPSTIYYEKDVYRVTNDALGLYSKGCEWNTKAIMVPCTITLGIAEPWYEFREIGNVSTGTNSLNNLILKYNKVLATGDELIRTNNSVQGVLNTYKDTMNKIESNMEPNRLVTTDTYGRITYTDYSIQQLINRITELEAKVQALENA